jgi:hypothetical protein
MGVPAPTPALDSVPGMGGCLGHQGRGQPPKPLNQLVHERYGQHTKGLLCVLKGDMWLICQG